MSEEENREDQKRCGSDHNFPPVLSLNITLEYRKSRRGGFPLSQNVTILGLSEVLPFLRQAVQESGGITAFWEISLTFAVRGVKAR